jgi:hypothetical protein
VTRRGPAAVLLLLSACGGAGDNQREEVVFRVGATAGLSEFVPGDTLSGSSAAAADLILDPDSDHIEKISRDGSKLLLTRRSSSPYTAEQLASSLRSQRLVSARASGPELIEAVFTDAAAVERHHLSYLGFDLGPFALESQEPGRVRLRRRGRSAIDVIEIVEVSASDEWRKLMARELDVMSSSPALFREQFAGMNSVRLLDIPPTLTATLYFNVRSPGLNSPATRRRIAAALNGAAIARVATGDEGSAIRPAAIAADEAVQLPARLSLLVGEHESAMQMAASVIRHQLGRLNIAVDIDPLPLDQIFARLASGQHQLALGPLPKGERRFGRFLTPTADEPSVSGFADPEYDTAVSTGDLARAQAILDREIPAIELFEWRTFAAIDSRFCGDATPDDTSWRWMADLRPCENGEGEGGTP